MSEIEDTEETAPDSREGFEGGPDGPEAAAARAERERAAVPDEATVYPNRADPDHWEAIGAIINDLCGGTADIAEMVECLRLNWKTLANVRGTIATARGIELAKHEAEAQRQDDERAALDARIAELRG